MASRSRSLPMFALSALLAWPVAAVPKSLDILLNCWGCHSLDQSDEAEFPSPYPVLNGQPARYIAQQLHAFRTGLRQHPQMQLSAQALGPEGDVAMARMYAYAPVPDLVRAPDADTPEGALDLVENGAWERGIAPCASCHTLETVDGIDMAGRTMPRLHGQPRFYLAQQLRSYADGTRQTGPLGRMQAYAAALDPAEIEALAAYYASYQDREAQ